MSDEKIDINTVLPRYSIPGFEQSYKNVSEANKEVNGDIELPYNLIVLLFTLGYQHALADVKAHGINTVIRDLQILRRKA
jgi:hypothetical protein